MSSSGGATTALTSDSACAAALMAGSRSINSPRRPGRSTCSERPTPQIAVPDGDTTSSARIANAPCVTNTTGVTASRAVAMASTMRRWAIPGTFSPTLPPTARRSIVIASAGPVPSVHENPRAVNAARTAVVSASSEPCDSRRKRAPSAARWLAAASQTRV